MRTTDPDDPSSVITTTTNFVFSMTQQVAMELCQHFMDARYIRNALDPSLTLFKDHSLHCLTPKGLHVLERFIEKTGIDADHLQPVFDSEIICPRLFHVERESTQDKIVFEYNTIITLFRWFVGQQPNYTSKDYSNLSMLQMYSKQTKGIVLADTMDRSGLLLSNAAQRHFCFDAVEALQWLCNFTSVSGRDEAAEVAAHFERVGLITLVGNPERYNNGAVIFTVYGSSEDRQYDLTARAQGEFRCVNKVYYQVTEKGRRIAGWGSKPTTPEPTAKRSSKEFEEQGGGVSEKCVTPANRLHYILKEQSYRSLFRAFLTEKYCEEHILYWLDVDAINRKSNVTSSAMSCAATNHPSSTATQAKQERRKHHQALLKKAVQIYKSYLHPNGQFELNTDYTLRNELFRFIDSVPLSPSLMHMKKGQGADLEERTARIMSCNSEQLQNLMAQFNKIQGHTFRVMLIDSLPKFVQTEKFIALQQQLGDIDFRIAGTDSALPPGTGEAFVSYSYLVK
ncbi:hypothetical protein C0992_002493 [Termitomyces sp. T32_za158]|nr:hypothetical protein C0992_002493 [Termitomyces sp. T32_za158]